MDERLTGVARKLGWEIRSSAAMEAGANSCLWQVRCADGQRYVVKTYRTRPGDTRDRLETEYQALLYLWQQGWRQIPEPIVKDETAGLAVFRFIDGRRLASEEITVLQTQQAARVLLGLRNVSAGAAQTFAPASEACLCLQAYVEAVRARHDRLCAIADAGLQKFLTQEWEPFLGSCVRWFERQAGIQNLDLQLVLPRQAQILSPSDVGFHNILWQAQEGQLYLIDFEYFGWDDPVKLACDFVLEPGVPLPPGQAPAFLQTFLGGFPDPPALHRRFGLVYPLVGHKWCGIMLNAFLPGHAEQLGDLVSVVQATQLAKARAYLNDLIQVVESDTFIEWVIG